MAARAMRPIEILDQSLTPDGEPLELTHEHGYYVLRVSSRVLMSSARTGSEQRMAEIAAEMLAGRRRSRVLVGGLGLGFTLRAALDAFGKDARVTVAELLPDVVRYNRGVLGPLARHPLLDPRTTLFEGDVRIPLRKGRWDAVLLDVDNGPEAFTAHRNRTLYDEAGVRLLAASLTPGGVAVIWSVGTSRSYERALRRAGLTCHTQRVPARAGTRKGGRHVLFVAQAPR